MKMQVDISLDEQGNKVVKNLVHNIYIGHPDTGEIHAACLTKRQLSKIFEKYIYKKIKNEIHPVKDNKFTRYIGNEISNEIKKIKDNL